MLLLIFKDILKDDVAKQFGLIRTGDDFLLDLLSEAAAMSLSVNGFVNDLVREFPMEYGVELKRLIDLEMEGSVG